MWRQIFIPRSYVETSTEKAVLISIPAATEYAGYQFWVAKKMLRDTPDRLMFALCGKDGMTYTVTKGRWKAMQTVVMELSILASQFGGFAEEPSRLPFSDNTGGGNLIMGGTSYEHHKPELLEPLTNPKAHASLVR